MTKLQRLRRSNLRRRIGGGDRSPFISYNHNETLVSNEVELSVEELEEVIALRHIPTNHNETIVGDEIEMSAEELEEVVAPYISFNHNETIVSEEVELSD